MEYQFAHGLVKSKVVEDLRKIEDGEIGKEDLHLLKGVYKTDLRIFIVLCTIILFLPAVIGGYWMIFEQFGDQRLYYTGIAMLITIAIIWWRIAKFYSKVLHDRTKSYWRFIIRRINRTQKRNRA